MKLYSLTDEHRARLPEWRDRWIANAMSTTPMTDDDRRACVDAVHGMYAAAKLPPPKHVVFVESPFVLAFAGGFSAARWRLSKTGAIKATADDLDSATASATASATYSAAYSATASAAYSAAYSATRSAAYSATDYSKWYVVPGDMRRCADELGVGDFGLACAANAFRMWQGGNQWSAWDSFLTFFQDVAQLPIDYSAYNHWRTLSERSGPRIVHPDFCMISDRPTALKVDDQNQPHCEDGPFCTWRDGSELYAWHGARLPAQWIRERKTIDPAEILKTRDVELRAAGAACVGWPRMLSALNWRVLDADVDPSHGELIELTIEGLPRPGRFLKAECPRNGTIVEGVPFEISTVLAAQAWRVGLAPHEFSYPTVRT